MSTSTKCEIPVFEKMYNRMAYECTKCHQIIPVSGRTEESVKEYVEKEHEKQNT